MVKSILACLMAGLAMVSAGSIFITKPTSNYSFRQNSNMEIAYSVKGDDIQSVSATLTKSGNILHSFPEIHCNSQNCGAVKQSWHVNGGTGGDHVLTVIGKNNGKVVTQATANVRMVN